MNVSCFDRAHTSTSLSMTLGTPPKAKRQVGFFSEREMVDFDKSHPTLRSGWGTKSKIEMSYLLPQPQFVHQRAVVAVKVDSVAVVDKIGNESVARDAD